MTDEHGKFAFPSPTSYAMTLQKALHAVDEAIHVALADAARANHEYAPALRIIARDIGEMVEGRYPGVRLRPVVLEDFGGEK